MVYGIISIIVLILILLVVGFIIRKKYYKQIDRLEAWKIDIMNRPVLDELGKVKQLNMTGQTEEKFERWRRSWDEIVTVRLPDAEDYLFDIEEYTDKYRFKRAKSEQEKLEKVLQEIEATIETILSELSELIGSEEKNKVEIEHLQKKYKSMKKHLLIHRHNYGDSIKQLETDLNAIAESFGEFDNLTANGDYLEAREIVIGLTANIAGLEEKIEKLPELITEIETVLPSQLKEIEEGKKEMLDKGFILEHLQLEKETQHLQKALGTYSDFLEKAEITEVENGIQEIKEKIEILYDLLEKEVHAKHYLQKHHGEISGLFEELKKTNEEIKTETEIVQESYQLLDGEQQIPHNFEKELSQLIKRYSILETKIMEDNSAYTILSEELKEVKQLIEKIGKEQQEFTEHLQTLRKDELEAREKVQELRRKIAEMKRLISKSNVPGLPFDYQSVFDQALEYIQDVFKSLNEKPLNMASVQNHLNNAVDTVEHLSGKTEDLIESVLLAEKVIQYGNRYRARYQKVAIGLQQAEEAFRSFDYRLALEEAATAVEAVEPGALKEIEKMLSEE
ncbi:septation ring formation regulator EzrA [Bacillus sp. FJAT-49736]|nr:septation ring formation regulator EzrA [Bacillus sp. FJAT-49736]MBS4173826.1 septation ring formation regulator EzrA [Bacillus sp. FJAT-49736]